LSPFTCQVKVIPKSSQAKVVSLSAQEVKVYVHSAPDKGKANDEVVALLAKHFGVTKSQVEIVRGQTSHHKVLRISE
jgi:uncharacterized protein